MVSNDTVLRIARMTDNWAAVSQMYREALGFESLVQFEDEHGYDGIVLGHKEHNYHLEFTSHQGAQLKQQVADSFLVFFIADTRKWEWTCRAMIAAGFTYVDARNPYWNCVGKTFEDLDGYRVVIQNREFSYS